MANKKTLVQLPLGMRNEEVLYAHTGLQGLCPQLYAWLYSGTDVGELRVKLRDDDSWLAIAKGFDADGTPVVAFGVGTDFVGSLKGLEGTIARNGWRPDRPWQANGK